MPLLGGICYWKWVAETHAQTLVLPIAVWTIGLPVLSFFVLKRLGKIQSMVTVSLSERLIPLALQTVFLFALLKLVDWKGSFPLYNFYVGCMISALLAAMILAGKVKASLHMMGIAGVTTFLLLLSFYTEQSLLIPFCGLTLITGLVGSSRLAMNAHTPRELFWGTVLGVLPQWILSSVWLNL